MYAKVNVGRLRLSVQLHSNLKTTERVSIFERTVRVSKFD